MSRKNKLDLKILKLKRAGMFFLGMSFFLMPGQNYYLSGRLSLQSPQTREVGSSMPEPAAFPENYTGQIAPWISAKAALILDADSSVLIYGKEEKTELLPASTVKIMTALIALDSYGLEDILTVQKAEGFGQDMQLVKGEQITFKNLLAGLLVYSANDAAWVLAQNYPGGEGEFVKAMNRKAGKFHLENTYFANPSGVNSDEGGKFLTDFSYTNAVDLARLSAEAMKNPIFQELVATKQVTVTDVTGKFRHPLVNLNELLGRVEGVKGIKTGWTEDAQGCLVAYTERNDRRIISVVLGSDDRFGETKKLIDWTFANFRWEQLSPILQ
jgi:D-alanyl-D-alanine carboxypeptidase (penicillin-binding protein 5/6)